MTAMNRGIFREINERVAGQDIVRMLGLEMNQSGFILCPAHSDSHPSCKIYKDGWYCHVCHNHGDNVDLVARTRGISNADAVKEINSYFCLGYDLKGKAEKQKVPTTQKPSETYKKWKRLVINMLTWWRRNISYAMDSTDAPAKYDLGHRVDYLDMVLDDMAVSTPEEIDKEYRDDVNYYKSVSRECRKLLNSGQYSKNECIKRALGVS